MSTSPIAPIQVRNPLGHNARAFVVSGSTKTIFIAIILLLSNPNLNLYKVHAYVNL